MERHGADLRRSVRIRKAANISVAMWREGCMEPPSPARIQDYSAGGVGVISPKLMPRGSSFLIEAEDNKLLYMVAHCSPTADGQFFIGAEFMFGTKSTQPHLDQLRQAMQNYDREKALITF